MNNRPPYDAKLPSMIRKSQLIAVALMLGVIAFGLIAVFIGGKVKPATPIMAYLAVAFAAQVIALRFFIPGLVVKSQLEEMKDEGTSSVAERLQGLFQIKVIIGMALLEGAALFNLIAYIANGQWFSLATAGFLLVLIGMMFPTMHAFESWIEDVERNMDSHF